jgi:hypothetical protein
MLYRRRVLTRARVAALGYVYVVLGVAALAVDGDHERAATAFFTVAAFAYLWFLGSLRAQLVRFDPDGFFASVVVLGGASFVALQAAALAAQDVRLAAPAAGCAATVVISSSLAALRARKVSRWFGRLGITGGVAVLAVGFAEAAADWTLWRSTVWASALGFMIWVVVTATYLLRREL